MKSLPWDTTIGQSVRIYRNLNNHRISVQVKVPKRGWLVVGHVTHAVLANVTFQVSESGRQRVIQARSKNVHAYAQGVLVAEFAPEIDATIDLKYDPYNDRCFVQRQTQRPIAHCRHLVVRANRVFVSQDALTDTQPHLTQGKLKLNWVPNFNFKLERLAV